MLEIFILETKVCNDDCESMAHVVVRRHYRLLAICRGLFLLFGQLTALLSPHIDLCVFFVTF